MADELMTINNDELKKWMALVIEKTKSIDFTWQWPCGVAFYGITRAWKVLRNDDDIAFLTQWVDRYIDIGLPPFMVNTVSMGHTLIALFEITGDQKYLDLALRKADYLEKDALRFGDRVLQHTVSAGNDFPGQAWADTLFMAAYFLLRLGKLVGNDHYVDDALHQFTSHEELLQDNKSNLFYHGYDHGTDSHMSGVYWGRANAWAAYTMAEAMTYINYLYPQFMAIDGALRDQLSALVRLQTPNGLWRTVLDNPDTYEEISASAGIAAALVRYGHPLHRHAAVQAYGGVVSQIDDDGSVRGVSAGTAVMDTPGDYNKIPTKRVQGWGQGLALAFLTSLAEYQERQKNETDADGGHQDT